MNQQIFLIINQTILIKMCNCKSDQIRGFSNNIGHIAVRFILTKTESVLVSIKRTTKVAIVILKLLFRMWTTPS